MQGGTPVYIREGRVFPGGGFGGDLREAVQGNAEAESYAKSYRNNMIAGVASTVGGSLLYFSNATGPESERNSSGQAIGGTLAISGVVAYVTGMVLMLNAQPHLWDAINSYNDSVEYSGSQRAYGTHVAPIASATLPLVAPVTPINTVSAGAPLAPPPESVDAPHQAPASIVPPALDPGPNATAHPGTPEEIHIELE
jgi:hypothetical protein